jgi:hypothetical protein
MVFRRELSSRERKDFETANKMSFFGGGSSSSTPAPQTTSATINAKNALIDKIRTEMAINTAQNLIEVPAFLFFIADMKTINRNCFERCITNPSGKLENSEQVGIHSFVY